MDEYESLSHTKWECKYHVVFIPKCRRKTLYEQIAAASGEVFQQAGRAEGEPDRGRAFDERPRAHDDRDPAEVRGVAGGRLSSRGRAPFTWRGCMGSGSGISWGSTFGRGGISCPRLAGTKR